MEAGRATPLRCLSYREAVGAWQGADQSLPELSGCHDDGSPGTGGLPVAVLTGSGQGEEEQGDGCARFPIALPSSLPYTYAPNAKGGEKPCAGGHAAFGSSFKSA